MSQRQQVFVFGTGDWVEYFFLVIIKSDWYDIKFKNFIWKSKKKIVL
jgi:hypothetical protein